MYKFLVTREAENGKFDDVGTTNRTVWSDLKTLAGAHRRAKVYAQGRTYRIEVFHAEDFYADSPIQISYGV